MHQLGTLFPYPHLLTLEPRFIERVHVQDFSYPREISFQYSLCSWKVALKQAGMSYESSLRASPRLSQCEVMASLATNWCWYHVADHLQPTKTQHWSCQPSSKPIYFSCHPEPVLPYDSSHTPLLNLKLGFFYHYCNRNSFDYAMKSDSMTQFIASAFTIWSLPLTWAAGSFFQPIWHSFRRSVEIPSVISASLPLYYHCQLQLGYSSLLRLPEWTLQVSSWYRILKFHLWFSSEAVRQPSCFFAFSHFSLIQ